MRRRPTSTLHTGDQVLYRGQVYVAVEIDYPECWTSCALWDQVKGSCPGACYRFRDDPPVSFRWLKDADELKPKEVVAVSITEQGGIM